MKKHLLIGMTLSIGSALVAQTSTPAGITPQKINSVAAKQALPASKGQALGGPATESFESMVNAINPRPRVEGRSVIYTIIGGTGYQLQTNSSICNRVVKSSTGTISATWTYSIEANSPWSDRGTGYNYFNGTSWGAAPTVRVENVRTGFSNVGITGAGATGSEFVVTHEAPASGTGLGTHIASRAVKGTGAWTDATIGAMDTWPRLVVGGSAHTSLHIIAQTSGATTPIVPFHGQDGAISYSRSQDGGLTWDKLRTVIPQIDSSNYLGFGGDAYAMDAKGDTIAIVGGGFHQDVVLIKSIDNGNTWTKTIVKSFPIPLYDPATMTTDVDGDGSADTIESNDASLAVLLDNLGRAHVWYGKMRVVCSTPGTSTGQGLSYFPATDGLMYWNETMGSAQPVMIAGVLDINGDGTLNIDYDPSGTLLGFGTYQTSLTSFPSAGIDASGKLFVTYSAVFEGINDAGNVGGASSANPGKSFRHQYLMRSDDNGATWCNPMDLTDPDLSSTYDYEEGVYGAMAKNVDGFVHVVVQQDQSAGHGVSTTTSPDIQTGTADILYYKIPVANLACDAGVHEISSSVAGVNLYPNPASNSVSLVINTTKATKATVKIYDVVGQEVNHLENNLTNGSNAITIDITKYKAGIYFVAATVDGKIFTQKLVVE